ncbi:hypothetical protein M0813_21369 [Anaeramoeba flamelloides]|uniref:Uncharacterized protein n=1 Tax=Anaeramoeba flamelloides TaxID=1746091 RepID=A0ABQ8YHX2_9EUKA|nr:hypothetical protein M0813_21369 [Anaeramoeba flamelloides]
MGNETSEKNTKKRQIGQRQVISSILAGNFYENYREHLEMLGVYFLKKTAYQQTVNNLMIETNILFQKHLASNRSKMDLKNLKICVDAGWSSRGHYANECAFIIIDKETGLLFDLIVVTRDKFSGPSGNMEAEAARIFCEKHKNTIELKAVVKDGDTKLAQVFESTWKSVTILKDLNHLLKNLRKFIEKIKFPFFKEISRSFSQWVRLKANNCWSSLEFKIQIKLSLFHYLDIHDFCEHDENYKHRYQFPALNITEKKDLEVLKSGIRKEFDEYLQVLDDNLKKTEKKIIQGLFAGEEKQYWEDVCNALQEKINYFSKIRILFVPTPDQYFTQYEVENESKYNLTPQFIELKNLIFKIVNKAEMYVTAYSTNKCESFMNSRTKFIDKRIDSSKQWEMRCQFSVLNRELPEWRTILMDQIGFTINLPQMVSQFQKNREKEYEKERQTKPEYIKYRYQQKNKKFHRRDGEIANGGYKFKDANVNKTIYKKKFRCRSCSSRYSIELSQLEKKKKNDQDEIEIFKEIDEEDEFDERNSEEECTGEELTENGFSEINKILTASDLKPSSGPKYDEIFGISFDKRLPSSFNNNNLLFEIDRNKNK